MPKKKSKPKQYICKYCDAETSNKSYICPKCYVKLSILQGWKWYWKGERVSK